MLNPIFDLITDILAWFYSVWPSYGMSIVFLTFVTMLFVTPLTMKSTRTMMKIQLLSPEFKKIQKDHQGDRAAVYEAQTALYKEHGLNPLGGCLPVVVQAPIFFVLYRVVLGLTRRATEIGTQLGHTSFQFFATENGNPVVYGSTPILRDELNFDPDFLPKTADLYGSLSDGNEMVSWGIDLARSANAAMNENVVEALPYFLMMALVLVTGLYQQRQIQRRQTSSHVNPTQQAVMKFIPYFLPVVSFGIPAAVVVYFIVSSLCRIGQQYYIGRSLYSGEESLGSQLARQKASSAKKGLSGSKSSKPSTPKSPGKAASSGTARSSRRRGTPPTRSANSSPSRRVANSSSRSGKAPSRSSRHRNQNNRVSPPGHKTRRSATNRSKRKKKRR